MMMKTKLHSLFIGLALFAGIKQVAAQGITTFTYQGQLRDGGTNANGAYTMFFKLYDAVTGGNQIGSTLTSSPTLANGLFTVDLDFGGGGFDGSARWLEITVQAGASAPETLAPRVQVLPSPYAIFAGAAANLSGGAWNASVGNYQTYTNVMLFMNNGSLVLGMSTNGVLINGGLQMNGGVMADSVNFNGGGSISGTGVNFHNGGGITSDGQGGLNINGGLQVNGGVRADSVNFNGGGSISSNGVNFHNGGGITSDGQGGLNINGANGQISGGNLHLSGNNITFAGTGGTNSTLWSDGHGGFSFNSGGVSIDRAGNLNTLYEINVNNGTAVLSPNGDIQGNWFTGLGFNASAGIACSYLNATGAISAQTFVTTSDRNLKATLSPIDNQEILERVAGLPISRWNFKTDEQTWHIGPMAQDFYAAFKVGPDDKHIATVDEGGVALAAIQGLNEKLQAKDAQIGALEKRLADLERLVKTSTQK